MLPFIASLTPREQDMLTDDMSAWLGSKATLGEAVTAEVAFAAGWCLGYLHSTVEPGNRVEPPADIPAGEVS